MAKTLVYADAIDGTMEKITYELLNCATQMGGPVSAALLGPKNACLAQDAITHGVETVFIADNPELAQQRAAPYARALETIVRKAQPDIVLLPAAYRSGRAIGPRLAALLDAPYLAECDSLRRDNNSIIATRRVYADALIGEYRATAGITVATVIGGAYDAIQPDASRKGTIENIATQFAQDELLAMVKDIAKATGSLDLTKSKIIVAAGRGVGSAEKMKVIQDLADLLGGAVGGTRAVTDMDLLPHEAQIGQTGVTVKPDLYIACGISGAIQHLVGMRDSKCIIAINKDENAPIFKIAHYGIVDDLHNAIPELMNAIKQYKHS